MKNATYVSPRLRVYYTPERIKEMVDFANQYVRVFKAKVVDIDVTETIIHYPFVAFKNVKGETELTEWF